MKKIKIKEREYFGDIIHKDSKVIFLNKKGCVVYGYVEGKEIESKGSLGAVNIRSHGPITINGFLKSRQFIIAEGSIIVRKCIFALWSIYSKIWIKAGGFIIAKEGSITAVEYIVSGGVTVARSWITCEKKIESGEFIYAKQYIEAKEIAAGLKSEGDWEKQLIKTEEIKGKIVSGTYLSTLVDSYI